VSSEQEMLWTCPDLVDISIASRLSSEVSDGQGPTEVR